MVSYTRLDEVVVPVDEECDWQLIRMQRWRQRLQVDGVGLGLELCPFVVIMVQN